MTLDAKQKKYLIMSVNLLKVFFLENTQEEIEKYLVKGF